MAKINTYAVVPSPASLSDMLIGTNVSSNNETSNFEISQILALYPSITQKASFYSDINQVTDPGTPIDISFNNTDYITTSFTLVSGNTIQFNNAGYYSIDLFLNVESGIDITKIYCWLNVNSSDFGPAFVQTFLGESTNTIYFKWQVSLSASDDVKIKFDSDEIVTLKYLTASGLIPEIMSAKLFISQV